MNYVNDWEPDKSEVLKRLDKLADLFTPEKANIPVITCVNVDTSKVPRDPAGPDPASVVSILHKITQCEVCGDDCWIGPKQAQAKGTRVCYFCFAIVVKYGAGDEPEVTSLNPDIDKAPRRLT